MMKSGETSHRPTCLPHGIVSGIEHSLYNRRVMVEMPSNSPPDKMADVRCCKEAIIWLQKPIHELYRQRNITSGDGTKSLGNTRSDSKRWIVHHYLNSREKYG